MWRNLKDCDFHKGTQCLVSVLCRFIIRILFMYLFILYCFYYFFLFFPNQYCKPWFLSSSLVSFLPPIWVQVAVAVSLGKGTQPHIGEGCIDWQNESLGFLQLSLPQNRPMQCLHDCRSCPQLSFNLLTCEHSHPTWTHQHGEATPLQPGVGNPLFSGWEAYPTVLLILMQTVPVWAEGQYVYVLILKIKQWDSDIKLRFRLKAG